MSLKGTPKLEKPHVDRELDDKWFGKARAWQPKVQVSVWLDKDVVEHFGGASELKHNELNNLLRAELDKPIDKAMHRWVLALDASCSELNKSDYADRSLLPLNKPKNPGETWLQYASIMYNHVASTEKILTAIPGNSLEHIDRKAPKAGGIFKHIREEQRKTMDAA
jgi:hypothetical protein